jgi:hypothetical protein
MSTQDVPGESELPGWELPRSASGDPDDDRLLAMLSALAAEVAVLRARLDTHERLAAERGVFDRSGVEQYAPSTEVVRERQVDAQQLIARVFAPLTREVEALTQDEAAQAAVLQELTGSDPKKAP